MWKMRASTHAMHKVRTTLNESKTMAGAFLNLMKGPKLISSYQIIEV